MSDQTEQLRGLSPDKGVVLSLFDLTGNAIEPWVKAGWEGWIVDVQHKPGVHVDERGIFRVGADIRHGWLPPRQIVSRLGFIFAFPPCDHVAVSGARWFKGKGLRKLSLSLDLFATAAEICEWSGVPYLIENPVSTVATYWRKPDYTFHPWQYSLLESNETYTKNTCLWTGGGFRMPDPCPIEGVQPDDRIHQCPPGPERANFRSATPRGFARAVFQANREIATQHIEATEKEMAQEAS